MSALVVFAISLSSQNSARAWEIQPSEDGFGTKRILALTYFDQSLNLQSPDFVPDSDRYAAFALRCMDKKVDILFASYVSDKPLKWVKQSTVEVKYNDGKIEKMKISFPPDKSGIFFDDIAKLLQKLSKSKQLAIRGNGFTQRISANFDVTKFDLVRKEFKSAGCKV